MGEEEKKSKRTRLAEKAAATLGKAFRDYQEWQLECSRQAGEALDPGDTETFCDWVKETLV